MFPLKEKSNNPEPNPVLEYMNKSSNSTEKRPASKQAESRPKMGLLHMAGVTEKMSLQRDTATEQKVTAAIVCLGLTEQGTGLAPSSFCISI